MCLPLIAGAAAGRALVPGAPALPPRPAATPRLPDEGVRLARADELSRRRRAAGRASTILTGPGGATGSASTTGNTLLGQ